MMNAMPMDRRQADEQRPVLKRLADRWLWVLRGQSQFSIVSSALALVLAVTLIVDYAVGHEHIRRDVVALWVLSYVVLTVLPLLFGSRYPLWAGLLVIGYLTYWMAHNLLRSNHPHMELNALLEAPMIAVYLGWFYRPWIARTGLLLHLAVMTVVVIVRPESDDHEFSTWLALIYAVMIAGFCLEAATFLRRNVEREAAYDQATGALNRHGLVQQSTRVFDRALRTGEPLVLAVVDFDDFKAVNDAGGHAEGDRALRTCRESWSAGLGDHDLVARTGGDEFVLVIHGDEAAAHARLRTLKAEAEFSWSWGLTSFAGGDTLDSLMLRADRALYEQKNRRRN